MYSIKLPGRFNEVSVKNPSFGFFFFFGVTSKSWRALRVSAEVPGPCQPHHTDG